MKDKNSIKSKDDKTEEIEIKKVSKNNKVNKSNKKNEEKTNKPNQTKQDKKEVLNKNKTQKKNIQKKIKKDKENIVKEKSNKKEKLDYKNYEEVLEKSLRKKKKITIILGIILLILAFIIFSIIFSLLNINNEKIFGNVFIQGIDVSNMSKNEAKERLEEICNNNLNREILLKYNEYETTLNVKIIDTKFDVNSAIEQAYSIGRKGNIISNNYEILGTTLTKKNVELNVNINEEELNKIIEEITQNLPGTIIESGYYVEGDNLIITKGKEGNIVNKNEFIQRIYNELKDIDSKSEFIEIPVENKKPEEINLETIKKEIYKEAQNAYYIKDPFEIHPEVDGVDFDIEKAQEILKEDKEEYTIPLIITKPEVTLEKIGSEAFPNTLGVCTTKYDMSNTARTTNLQLATDKINGKVLLPGEEFSYNTIVGERSIAAGYKEAKVYENGQVVDGLGGGICQISSTLYDAVVFANLEVTQRRNHQFITSYLPAGKDATVVYGSQDFKFKNTRKYPIKVVASINSGIAKIEIKGLKEETEPEISFETHTISIIPYSIKYIDDSSLYEGEEKIQQKGVNGIVTETYKVERINGVITSKTLLSKDTYNAMQRVIYRGTKKQPEKTVETVSLPSKDKDTKNNEEKQENKQDDKKEKNNKIKNDKEKAE